MSCVDAPDLTKFISQGDTRNSIRFAIDIARPHRLRQVHVVAEV